MAEKQNKFTRRDFIKTAGCAAIGVAAGLPALAQEKASPEYSARVVLVRHENALDRTGKINADIIQQMLDDGVKTLHQNDDLAACWQKMISPEDIVGIKTNVWERLPTTTQVENAIKRRVMDAGVPEANISVRDRGLLDDPIFRNATALINARPMRTHAWAGVGSLIKNYIMFSREPWNYHDNSCASLAKLWQMPICKGKTRLNVLVMLTPLFYGVGPHHFDPTYTWPYQGLLIGTDPVAVDAVGLRLFQLKRREYFGEDKPISPTAHHIRLADKEYGLGVSDLDKIELVKIGWQEGAMI